MLEGGFTESLRVRLRDQTQNKILSQLGKCLVSDTSNVEPLAAARLITTKLWKQSPMLLSSDMMTRLMMEYVSGTSWVGR